MGLPVHEIQVLGPVLAEALVASIWQGALLTAGVWLCLRVLGGTSATVRSAIWSAVLVLVLCLPVLEMFALHTGGHPHGAVHAERGWGWALLTVWLAASLVRAFGLVRDASRLRGVARRAVPQAVEPAIAALLPVRRHVEICLSDEVNRPSVLGLLRPRILVPTELFRSLSTAELEQVVLHEVEHLRRGDDWMNLLQQISLMLLPLQPALFWLDRRLCRERELACDDSVLRATRARKAYAACLVKLAEDSMLRRGVSVALSVLGSRARESELVSRVWRVLAGQEPGEATRRVRLAATGVVGVAVLLAGVLAGSPEVVSFEGQSSAAVTPLVAAVSPAAAGDRGLASRVMGSPMATMTSAVEREPMARPVLARAVMPSSPGQVFRPAAANLMDRRMRRVRAIRAAVHSRAAARSVGVNPWSTVPVAQRWAVPEPRMVMTEMEASQPIYAAVPWRGGWLIVQL